MGEIASNTLLEDRLIAIGNLGGVAVSNAYEVAKTVGAPHHGWLEKQRQLPTAKLLKSIRSLEKQIAQHRQWIDNPYLKLSLIHI